MAAYGGQKDFRLPTTAPGRLLFTGSNSSVHPEEQLEGGALWHHLERHKISFRNYGEGFELAGADEGTGLKPTGAKYMTNIPMPDPLFRNTARDYPNYNTNIPDQFRATQFIKDVQREFVEGNKELPRLIFIHLPNDHLARPRREDGYPVEASFMADNDYALGRIIDFLSHTKWWQNMAVLVTEDDAQGGVDHIDTHRTVFMAIGPHVKQNYVSRVNTSMPSLLKTTFRLLGIPPIVLAPREAGPVGWVTGARARKDAGAAAHTATVAALAPFCAERFRAQGDAPARIAELAKASTWERSNVVEKSGFATMPGTKNNDSDLARACVELLMAPAAPKA
ncbi:MAG: hypothetical protein IBJ17_17835 [Reyranella sp.]|nr:hypothetical protein [Reyranella sp.]